jgi:hypothetical protein
MFRRNINIINKNLPCSSDSFVQESETLMGQMLSYRPIGRPKKGSVPFIPTLYQASVILY